MSTYFDKREGREKTVPDCRKHGLVWNEQTQRCERTGLIEWLMSYLRSNQIQRTGLGFMTADEGDWWDWGGGGGDYFDGDWWGGDGYSGGTDEYGYNYYFGDDGSYWDDYGNYCDAAGECSGPDFGGEGGIGEGVPGFEDYGDGTSGYTAPDGAYTFTDAEGNETTIGADGTVTYNGADGQSEIYYPDGRAEIYNTDGSQEFVAADGHYTYIEPNGASYDVDAQGRWTWNDASGNTCSGDANGAWCCSNGECGGSWADAPPGPKASNDRANATRSAAQQAASGAQSGGSKQSAQQQQRRSQQQQGTRPNISTGAIAPRTTATRPRPQPQSDFWSESSKNFLIAGVAGLIVWMMMNKYGGDGGGKGKR